MVANPQIVTELMDRLRTGSTEAAGQLVALFYPELRKMARSQMRREGPGHTWQPTILVNQLYLELVRVKALSKEGREEQDDRKAFFGLAARMMRRMLIRHARRLYKNVEQSEWDDDLVASSDGTDDLAIVEDLLCGLERIDPHFRAVAELKIFEGLPMEDIANELNLPVRTAYRRWTFAREWLAVQLQQRRVE